MKTTPSQIPAPEGAALPNAGPGAVVPLAAVPLAPLAAQPGEYYLEGGRMVFNATYHLRRGYCCGSRCRHCPYKDWNR